ncbi:MAG TPA: ATP-grasp fold amidoligase family protein [Bacteroidales bacterium]|nr:ATP-grasp fold amidoligase family protein [Bacteroidales bacterium]
MLKFSKFIHSIFAVLLPSLYARYYYKKVTNRRLDLSKPKDYNEIVQWLKVYSDTSQWTELADKVKVRKYVEGCGLRDILVELYGVWTNANDIDFDFLPERFVLKTNNGCGKNLFIQNKAEVNFYQIRGQLNKWLKEKDGLVSFQPHIWNIERKILAEEFLFDDYNDSLSSSIIDYKFFCINGEPEIVNVIYDRDNKIIGAGPSESKVSRREQFYDLNWNLRPDILRDPSIIDQKIHIPEPSGFNTMLEICRILSKPFPQVRVDLYEVNKKVYFGEMTFTPGGMNDFTDEFALQMGKKINLSDVRLREKLFII